jgi:hypothetical protein
VPASGQRYTAPVAPCVAVCRSGRSPNQPGRSAGPPCSPWCTPSGTTPVRCSNVGVRHGLIAGGLRDSCPRTGNPGRSRPLPAADGNFGIVTEFEFRLHPLGPIVLAGLALFPLERAPEIMRGWRDCANGAPEELSTACVIVTAPPEPFVPVELQGQPVIGMAVLYVGDPDEGTEVVQPFKDLGPIVDHIGPMPYTAFQSALDPLAPWGTRFYAQGEYLPQLSDAAIDTFLAHAIELTELGAPLSQMVIFRIGQAVAAADADATAFSQRDANYLLHPISVWTDPADDARMIEANRDFAAAIRPFTNGAPTSTSPTRPTASETPTAMRSTPVWLRSRTPTTQQTCSVSTRTSAPPSTQPSRRSCSGAATTLEAGQAVLAEAR